MIALRGTLLLTNRIKESICALSAFGATLRHGLIPNLLGEGKVSRYNCRDATWFWLQSVKDLYSHGIESILEHKIKVGFESDEAEFDLANGKEVPVAELVQTMLQRHAVGISFTERNAGHKIDRNMDERGFQISSFIDWETGFPSGGNKWNCGTWMD